HLVLLPVDREREQGVRVFQGEHDVVPRQAQVQRVRAVAVQDRRHLVRTAQAACGTLAELGSQLGGDLHVRHGFSSTGGCRLDGGGRPATAQRPATTASITEPSGYGTLAEATR